MIHCNKCEDSGIHYASNGSDDFTPEYCSCPEGQRAEKASAIEILTPVAAMARTMDFLYEQGRKAGETPGDAWAMARDIN